VGLVLRPCAFNERYGATEGNAIARPDSGDGLGKLGARCMVGAHGSRGYGETWLSARLIWFP
jgi:hypothetical protein